MRALGVNLPAEWQRGVPYTHEPYAISVHPQAVLRQLWQLEQGWRLFVRTSAIEEYGYVIRCRPDLWCHSIEMPHFGDGCALNGAWVPWWGRFGGVNDRFAILGRFAAQHYLTTYSATSCHAANGCPIHPESLVAASLEANGCASNRLFAEFSTLRSNGEMRMPEISSIDLAHLHR